MEYVSERPGCTVRTFCPEETEWLGNVIGAQLAPGDVVSLVGELGSGKTCFTRGLARGMGIDCTVPIVSPTFTLINEYPGQRPLYHFDLYRIKDIGEVLELGYQEYFFGEGVTVIEWGERAEELLPEEHLKVEFFYQDETVRMITLAGKGKRFERVVQSIAL